MAGMFSGCSSLKELNLSNFNIFDVNFMSDIFKGCSSLQKLDINFDFHSLVVINGMFKGCSNEFKNKIRTQYENIGDEAFY